MHSYCLPTCLILYILSQNLSLHLLVVQFGPLVSVYIIYICNVFVIPVYLLIDYYILRLILAFIFTIMAYIFFKSLV